MKRKYEFSLLGALVVVGGVACSKPTAGETATEQVHSAQTPAEVELPTSLRVNPEVVKSGQITMATARASGVSGGGRVPGEVVSSPDGEAQVGVLVSGRVAGIEANVGDVVEKGAVLAWVEAVEIGVARAELQKASARLAMQEARVGRQGVLEAEGATSTAAVEAARADLSGAKAQQRAATMRLSAMGAGSGSGSRYPLRSPIEGVVTERYAVLGAAVRPEQTLFSIVAPGRVLVVARFNEGKALIPQKGTKMQLTPRGAPADMCFGTVETQAQVVDPHTRTILVRLRPDRSCTGLRPGAYVEVHAKRDPKGIGGRQQGDGSDAPTPSGAESSVEVSAESVVFVRGKETVFVAEGEPGHFEARRVVVRSMDEERAFIGEGLVAGDQVVERGTILLKGEMLREVLGGE